MARGGQTDSLHRAELVQILIARWKGIKKDGATLLNDCIAIAFIINAIVMDDQPIDPWQNLSHEPCDSPLFRHHALQKPRSGPLASFTRHSTRRFSAQYTSSSDRGRCMNPQWPPCVGAHRLIQWLVLMAAHSNMR